MKYRRFMCTTIVLFTLFFLSSYASSSSSTSSDSLLQVGEVVPDAICKIDVTPVKANVNFPISVDMSGSQYAKLVEVEVFDLIGNIISSKILTPESPRWQISFDKPGEYTFKGKALNTEDKPSENLCEAKIYINFPPTCQLWTSCLPCEDYVDRAIVFNGSNSTDPDGEIVRADFQINDETGEVVDRKVMTEQPFMWEKVFDKSGAYTVTLIVTDDFGAVSEPCRVTIQVTQKRFFLLVSGGAFFAKNEQKEGGYGPYIAARAGILYKIIPNKLSFIFSGGGGITLKGDPWKNIFMVSALLNLHVRPAFLGGGFGFTTKVKETRNTDVEFIMNGGFDVFDTHTSVVSIFGEMRAPVGKNREFRRHHKLMVGVRFLF